MEEGKRIFNINFTNFTKSCRRRRRRRKIFFDSDYHFRCGGRRAMIFEQMDLPTKSHCPSGERVWHNGSGSF